MNEIDAIVLLIQLDKACGINQMMDYKQPIPRLLKDFNIDEEGYCIFYEDYRSSKSVIQNCIILFVKTKNLRSKEIGNNIIIY